MRKLLIDLVALSAIMFGQPALSKPNRPSLATEAVKPCPPILIDQCAWGKIEQKGRAFTIAGNYYTADGIISEDGKRATITWVQLPMGTVMLGVYDIDFKGEMKGRWDYLQRVRLDVDGRLLGGNEDWLRKP